MLCFPNQKVEIADAENENQINSGDLAYLFLDRCECEIPLYKIEIHNDFAA